MGFEVYTPSCTTHTHTHTHTHTCTHTHAHTRTHKGCRFVRAPLEAHDSLASSPEAPNSAAVESPSPPERLKCD